MKEYPKLGTEVKYLRQDLEKQELVSGSGIAEGVFIDPKGKTMVFVRDGDNKYQIDLVAVNPDEGFEAKYSHQLRLIKEVTKEGNDRVKKVADRYNQKVDAMYKELLG